MLQRKKKTSVSIFQVIYSLAPAMPPINRKLKNISANFLYPGSSTSKLLLWEIKLLFFNVGSWGWVSVIILHLPPNNILSLENKFKRCNQLRSLWTICTDLSPRPESGESGTAHHFWVSSLKTRRMRTPELLSCRWMMDQSWGCLIQKTVEHNPVWAKLVTMLSSMKTPGP